MSGAAQETEETGEGGDGGCCNLRMMRGVRCDQALILADVSIGSGIRQRTSAYGAGDGEEWCAEAFDFFLERILREMTSTSTPLSSKR